MDGTKGMDGEKREESTTAAIAPTVRYDSFSAVATMHEESGMKDPVGKSLSNSLQCSPQEGHNFGSSRKPRGEIVDIIQENSHSSEGSNARSSNPVAMQKSEDNFVEEVHVDDSKESVGDIGKCLQEDSTLGMPSNAREEESDFNHHLDPLLSSVKTLQSVQEALKREVQKFSEIDRETLSPVDNLGMSVGPPDDQLDSAQISQSASSSEVIGISTFLENVKNLEVKLDEARTLLEAKDSKVSELESRIDTNNLHEEEYKGTVTIQPGICRDTDLDGLHKHRLESEVEGLTVAKSIEKLQCAARGWTNPLKRGKKQDRINTEMLSKGSATEGKVLLLKKLAKSSKKFHRDAVVAEDVVRLHAQTIKVASFLSFQLILVVLMSWWFMVQLPPRSPIFVPT